MRTPFSLQFNHLLATLLGIAVFVLSVLPGAAFAQSAAPQSSGGLGGAAAGAAGGTAACTLGSFFGQGLGVVANGISTVASVPVNDFVNNQVQVSNATRDDVMSCIARSIARSMLENMTTSVVNWINSGFNGSPDFIQNYDQFFGNVADQAAGQFIQGSDLAFLCSPFQLQVRIAVAQIYGSQNDPQACTISGITNNIEGFMNQFDQGGWPAFIAFTTMPSNNPYGALVSSEESLNSRLATVQENQQLDLINGGGFLSFKEPQNCHLYPAGDTPAVGPNQTETLVNGSQNKVCDLVATTPGSAINHALDQQFGGSVSSLVNAKYFDEIISALVSQLIQQTLYSGLSNLSSDGGYQNFNSSAYINSLNATANLSETLLQSIGSAITSLQQIIDAENQNVSTIGQTMQSLNKFEGCWVTVATSNAATAGQKTQALAAASSTSANIAKLSTRLAAYETILGHATSTMPQLDQLNFDAQNTNDLGTLQSIGQQFSSLAGSGVLPSPTDVSSVLADQSSLASTLSSLEVNGEAGYSQCQLIQSQLTGSPTTTTTDNSDNAH